jgi:hypothetical protein
VDRYEVGRMMLGADDAIADERGAA